jgi:hypothetical protein
VLSSGVQSRRGRIITHMATMDTDQIPITGRRAAAYGTATAGCQLVSYELTWPREAVGSEPSRRFLRCRVVVKFRNFHFFNLFFACYRDDLREQFPSVIRGGLRDDILDFRAPRYCSCRW